MKLLIDLDEEYVKAIDKIKFLVGGRTDRKLQLEIIKAIKNGKALEQEPILDKIFCMVHPLSIMSTPELEHKAIMQITEMLDPLCLPESEETDEV